MNIDELYSEKVLEHFKNPRNMGEIKDADGVATVGNPVCVPPQTLVMANSEAVPIEEIKTGRKVLGHDGCFHKVSKTYQRLYQGKIYRLRVHNLGEVLVTPEHHLLSAKTSGHTHKFVAFKQNKFILDWNRIDELEKGDFIAYPIPKEIKDIELIDFLVPVPKWDFKSKKLPLKIKIDKNLLRLVGYYLAEGYCRTSPSQGTVGFVFGAQEGGYVKEVNLLMEEVFGLKSAKIVARRNSLGLLFYSARLARFFSGLFGKGALEKQLPHWMMLLPLEKQKEILCGLWRGDGYINPAKKVSKFVTISPKLAYQVKLLLLRQKIISSFLVFSAKGIHKKHYCFYIKNEDSLIKIGKIIGQKLSFAGKIKNPRKTWFAGGFYYAPIWKNEKLDYTGPVLNLGVEKTHSYLVEAAALHNCGDIMRMFIKVGKRNGEEYVEDVKFQTLGCGAAISTSSMITTMVKGKPISEALKITNKAVAEALGGLPKNKLHCSVLAADALKKAIEDYQKKKVK